MNDYEKAKKRYNKLMNELGYEHLTIGEPLSSEDTSGYKIENMVAEMKTLIDTFDQFEHVNYGWKQEEPQRVRNYMNRINRFIKKYDE